MGPLDSPLAGAINRRMAEEHGQALRHRMLDGKAQFWVVRAGGQVVASTRLRDLAARLGVQHGGHMAGPEVPFSDPISREKAATITGYSTTALTRAAHAGKIQMHKIHARLMVFSRASAEKWAEEHRKAGGQFLPRRRRKAFDKKGRPVLNGRAPKRTTRAPGVRSSDRLGRYLAKLEGTPMQMSVEEFTVKAVEFMLDRLEK